MLESDDDRQNVYGSKSGSTRSLPESRDDRDVSTHAATFEIERSQAKYILKRALEEVLPVDVVWRKKAGFGAPIRSWLRGPLRPLVNDLLSKRQLNDVGCSVQRK
jgi:Asparagine synthase (glutamine-hydrolyzing)